MYGPGLSGPRGPGLGLRNEYVLVDAREVTPGAPDTAEASAACPPTPGTFPMAYELTGPREEEVAGFVGRRIELTGTLKEANARPVGTSGVLRPTGGFDPLGHELHLFEVEVGGVREVTAARAAAAPAEAPAPEVAEAAPAPEREAAAEPAARRPHRRSQPSPRRQNARRRPNPPSPRRRPLRKRRRRSRRRNSCRARPARSRFGGGTANQHAGRGRH
ncbi:MAG: hypothetical protein HYY76_12885 [Acidobacteria bacterium]|nr:hypothetical protein [Acidobacteriota bacterium]